MSVSVGIGDNLWGLIACHGTGPNLVPYEMREACKHIAASLTQQIETIEALNRSQEAERLATRREDLLANLAQSESLELELKRRLQELVQIVPSSGVIVCDGGTLALEGATPSAEQCRALCDWARQHDNTPPYSTDALPAEFGAAASYVSLGSGLLAITAGAEDPLDILWLRPEYPETIEWAGHPHKEAAEGDLAGELTPRKSFTTWRQSVSGKSQPWTWPEIEAAQRLREGIERIRSRQRLNSLQAKVIHMSRVNAMGTMASAIAHELNQPLTVVRNYVSGLSRMLQMQPDADPEFSDILRRVGEQALRAGEIVRHLRQLVAGGQVELEPLSMRELVENACSLALLDAPRLGVAAVVAIEDDSRVLADSIQIQQVLLNLMRNAIEAMSALEPGRERKLTVGCVRTGEGFVEVSVSDTGPGLSDEVRERLFSAFNSSKEGGLGIGLSICRTIVEAHGGKIWADDTDGGGATFRFTLQEALEHA
jgi:light-regulated signal transduction histidine kinase (bacteriophytochrome)